MSRKGDLEKSIHEFYDAIHAFELEMILIPAGEFLMGTREEDIPRLVKQYGGRQVWYEWEVPQHTLYLPDYYVAKTPTTNAAFAYFVDATRYVTTAEKEGGWDFKTEKYVKGLDWCHPNGPGSSVEERMDHPVVQVSWHDAMAYCRWLAKVTGRFAAHAIARRRVLSSPPSTRCQQAWNTSAAPQRHPTTRSAFR